MFISATIVPRITRNIKIPTWSPSDNTLTNPPLKACITTVSGFVPYKIAPTKIPIKSELYTSFVINANAIATTGGKSAQAVAYNDGT